MRTARSTPNRFTAAASGGIEGETFGTFIRGRALQELEQKREAGELWRQTIQLVRHYQAHHPENEFFAQSALDGA